jgi:hypothetical protein
MNAIIIYDFNVCLLRSADFGHAGLRWQFHSFV